MQPTRQRTRDEELTELAAKSQVDGVEIEARCWRIRPDQRYEIELTSGDQRAVVDLPPGATAQLSARIRQAIDAFRLSLQVRGMSPR